MSTIRSAATASRAVRSDASLTPAGKRNRADARNSDCPVVGAATHSVCSSSTLTAWAANTRLMSRTIPGRSCPTSSNRTSGDPLGAVADTSGCTIDSSPDAVSPRSAAASASARSASTSTRRMPAKCPARCAIRLSTQFAPCSATTQASASTSPGRSSPNTVRTREVLPLIISLAQQI